MARAPPSHRQRRCNHLPPAVPAVAAAHRNVTAVTRCSRRKSRPTASVCLPQQQNFRVRRRHCIRDTLPARATQRGAAGRHAAAPAPHLCWCRARCHRACERRSTPHSDTALSSQRKSIGYAGRGGPQGQTEAGIRSGPALATGRAIGGRTAWYRCVGGLHPPPQSGAVSAGPLQGPTKKKKARSPDDRRPPDMGHSRRSCVGRRWRGATGATPRGAVALARPPSPSRKRQ